MKDLTALKAKPEQARDSHAYRAGDASIRFTEDLLHGRRGQSTGSVASPRTVTFQPFKIHSSLQD